jgi:C4-dicarboxylate-specific signal transduction histidine kinase/ABC-type uncharacterized transport system substrate-binding protein
MSSFTVAGEAVWGSASDAENYTRGHRAIGAWASHLLAFASLALAAGLAQDARAAPRNILAVFEGERMTPAIVVIDKVLGQQFETAPGAGVNYFAEFMDAVRFPGAANEETFARFLRDRYSAKKLDVLIAVSPTSLDFLVRHRDELFPGVPVVFAGVSSRTLDTLALPRGFVGVPADFDATLTIDLALRLQPRARALVVVTGTTPFDREWERRLRSLTTSYEPRLKVRFLAGLPIDAVEKELAGLARDTIVLISSYRRDGAGQTFLGAAAVTRRFAKASAAPIYGVYSTVVGEGAVGTHSLVFEEVAAQAAEIAGRILGGAIVDSMALPETLRSRTIVDARELKRWGIDQNLLPPGSTVLFHEDTFWQRYRLHVLGVAVLVLLETLLVAGLLIQRKRRRQVEAWLRESERTMHLAARASQLVIWNWDIARDEVWISYTSQRAKRLRAHQRIGFERIVERIHAGDREAVRKTVAKALGDDSVHECEYRVPGVDGRMRWYAARGRVERVNGKVRWLRGVTLDITRRKEAELDAQVQRNELTHLSRVTLLGELSGSMAHELNQPLMAILSNAQAARMFIERDPIDLVELRAILDDIVENDKHAGQIIWGMRKMLKKEDLEYRSLNINDVVQEVLRLMRSDLVNRNVAVDTHLAAYAPPIRGDRTQLQQVLLNLVVNACDAMASLPRTERLLTVRTEAVDGGVRVVVCDRGGGIPAESLAGIFMPFVTTKKHGLGLGLAVCSSIITSHGGEISAANNADRGAAFTFFLRAETETGTEGRARAETVQ